MNEVLPNLAPIMELDRDFDSTLYIGYQGALTTLRSWAYFMLAKLNGEVGLVDGNLSGFDPGAPPVYLTKAEMIDKIMPPMLNKNNLWSLDILSCSPPSPLI